MFSGAFSMIFVKNPKFSSSLAKQIQAGHNSRMLHLAFKKSRDPSWNSLIIFISIFKANTKYFRTYIENVKKVFSMFEFSILLDNFTNTQGKTHSDDSSSSKFVLTLQKFINKNEYSSVEIRFFCRKTKQEKRRKNSIKVSKEEKKAFSIFQVRW